MNFKNKYAKQYFLLSSSDEIRPWPRATNETNPSTSSLGAARNCRVVPIFCVKRSFSTQSSASLTDLSTLFDEMVPYRVFENACDARVQCGTTAVMAGNKGHQNSLYSDHHS